MAIVSSASGDYLDGGDIVALQSLTQFSLAAWIKSTSDSNNFQTFLHKLNLGAGHPGWRFSRQVNQNNSKSVYFEAGWSTLPGIWETAASTFLINTLYHVGLTYDAGATANNPVIYRNAVSLTVTRMQGPTGSWATNSGDNLNISTSGANQQFVGSEEDIRIYSRILSAAEYTLLYNNGVPTNLEIIENGLIFHAPLLYSANRYPTVPFATALAGTDFLYDRAGENQLTPHGSIVGAAAIAYTGSGF